MVCPRVVIDTNIIISALIFAGRVSRLRLAWQDDLFTPLVSKATTTELIRVLAYPKFKLTPTEQEDLLADYILFCEAVTIPDRLPVIPECRDPFDLPFLLLAVVSEADYLVTGDRDLLSLKDNFSCSIITAEDFLNVIDGQLP
ncbi:putative toxin-antitoxin system toxin component, PIN family [Nostoc sp. TCL26-01]|nr:putative toxin-antitoxin system toxin component, PIN family [Nostoc sp. TCL26-01]